MEWYFWYYGIVAFFITLIIVRIYTAGNVTFAKRKSLGFKCEDLETGDLIMVKYDNALGYLMRAWSGSGWTHVGMIYKDKNDDIFVMETANYYNEKGVLLIPLQKWKRYNRNCQIGVMKLNHPENFESENLYKKFLELRHKKLDTFSTEWIRLLKRKPYTGKLQNNITCYELIIHLLQECEVIDKIESPDSYFPVDFIEKSIPYREGFSYNGPYEF